MKDIRLTCLLGAGAAIEIGGPTTECITKLVDDAWEQSGFRNVSYALKGNFEEKFHVLETLNSYVNFKHNMVNRCLEVKKKFRYWDYTKLCRLLLSAIGDRINEYNNMELNPASRDWFCRFWTDIADIATLDIATLNYDSCVEQCLHDYDDGFYELVEVMGLNSHCAYRFNPKILDSTEKTRVMHLHGCITYALGTTLELNKYAFDDSFHDLYKYDSYELAKEHWFGHSNPCTQDGFDVNAGPLITGLRKADKILVNPYMSYDYEFNKALMNNSSLLVVGYSCGDSHINAKLIRMKQMHSDRRRVVVISYLPDDVRENWNPDPYVREWPSNNEYEVISHLMGCEVAEKLDGTFLPEKDVIVSDDGCVNWYLCGFKTAAEKYKREIISFLLDKTVQ